MCRVPLQPARGWYHAKPVIWSISLFFAFLLTPSLLTAAVESIPHRPCSTETLVGRGVDTLVRPMPVFSVEAPAKRRFKNWAQANPTEKVLIVCALTSALLLLVSEIWFIVAGFKVRVLWGLFMLFFGSVRSLLALVCMVAWMVGWSRLTSTDFFKTPSLIISCYCLFAGGMILVFVTRHWQQARGPFLTAVLAILILVSAVLLMARTNATPTETIPQPAPASRTSNLVWPTPTWLCGG